MELKADGNLLMTLLQKEKFFSGEEETQLKVVKTSINQVGNALEGAYMWVELFKREHDDSAFFKKVVDDFSYCSLIN
jgi:predicted RNA-binding protein with EMAP domain